MPKQNFGVSDKAESKTKKSADELDALLKKSSSFVGSKAKPGLKNRADELDAIQKRLSTPGAKPQNFGVSDEVKRGDRLAVQDLLGDELQKGNSFVDQIKRKISNIESLSVDCQHKY